MKSSLLLVTLIGGASLSGCLLRTDDFSSEQELRTEIDYYETIKKEYINFNSWNVNDTTKAIKQIVDQLEKSDNFMRLLKDKKGVVRIKIGKFTDNTKEEGFPLMDIKNELLARLGQNNNIILIEKEDNDTLLDEISYQNDGMVNKQYAKNIGKQLGADLLLFGNINLSKAMEIDKMTKNYYLTVKMTDIESGVNSFMSVYKATKKYKVE